MNNQSIKLSQIPRDKTYQGYLWYSNEKAPDTMLDQQLPDFANLANPFIVEGNLFDAASNLSYQIRTMDGVTSVMQYDMHTLPDGHQVIDKMYLPQRLHKSVKELLFAEVWVPEPDPLCENMPVLKPAFAAFVGFKFKEE